ncbi:MAG: galactonate dehydratase [Lentisphaeria bacterium]|jgi:galactonate dehydratase|nr:galactonate dehydratase [Lentisphaeria bacterium]
MKITAIKSYIVDAYRTNWAFIKVETDAGLHGWGEASLGTQEMALQGCVEDLKRLIVGRNPLEIERMCFEVYRDIYWKGGPVLMSAISGIEMAMWDIAGKHFNCPLYSLLGGKMRDRVRMYANAWFTGARSADEFAAKARETAALGITALKWDPFGKAHLSISNGELQRAVDIVGAVREAVGPTVDLLIECHGRFNPYTALRIAAELAEFKPMLMEEPCPPDDVAAMAEVRRRSPVPIAGGERVYGKFDFSVYLEKQAVDIAQPDIFHTGGIMESKKIAAMAEARHIPVSFHNPSGPVSNAAILQLAACVPNFLIHEIMLTDGSFRKNISNEEVVYADGCIMIGDRPGLGIEINEEELAKYPYYPRNLRHFTGEVTDIRPKGDCVYYFKGLA